MGGGNDPRRLLRVLNLRQGYVELHGELETTLLGGQQAHPAVDRDIAHLGAFTTADHAQGTLEAGRVAHGEELFGFVPPPSPPISFGERSCTSRAPSFVRPWPLARPPVTVASAV